MLCSPCVRTLTSGGGLPLKPCRMAAHLVDKAYTSMQNSHPYKIALFSSHHQYGAVNPTSCRGCIRAGHRLKRLTQFLEVWRAIPGILHGMLRIIEHGYSLFRTQTTLFQRHDSVADFTSKCLLYETGGSRSPRKRRGGASSPELGSKAKERYRHVQPGSPLGRVTSCVVITSSARRLNGI